MRERRRRLRRRNPVGLWLQTRSRHERGLAPVDLSGIAGLAGLLEPFGWALGRMFHYGKSGRAKTFRKAGRLLMEDVKAKRKKAEAAAKEMRKARREPS